jgi:hypothetical protein
MVMRTRRLAVFFLFLPRLAFSSDDPPPFAPAATASISQIVYVAGSSQKICQLTGEEDKEFGISTVSQTETRFGLIGTDNGYSFEHNGRLYFLFGDTPPTALFNGHPNTQTSSPRTADDNDAIAYLADSSAGPFPKLNFVTDSIGAFKNPVVLDAQGRPAITLRTNETPVAGFSEGGRMYVIFATDNFLSNPPAGTSSPNGGATRTVVAASDDSAKTFRYLYNFSTAPGARFIFAAIAAGHDGFIYFWGAQGDTLYRKSPPFLARKPAGSMSDSTAIEYLHGLNPDGSPVFTKGEANAVPLFHDSLPGPGGTMKVADCVGEIGVEWNRYVQSWIMLYNSSNNSASNPRGIYMRYSPQPWGPWSPPQTIFNPTRDAGLCHFIHRAVTPTEPACDSLSGANRLADGGGDYSPYFVSRFTTGDSVQRKSTFYFVMSTWNPYEVVLMSASIQAVAATGVIPSDGAGPVRYELQQNYPNPFNPSTVISYRLPSDSDVRLAVYDLLGREVATLVNERQPAGQHTVRFPAGGVGARELASGVYVVRLQAGSFVAVKRMVFVK